MTTTTHTPDTTNATTKLTLIAGEKLPESATLLAVIPSSSNPSKVYQIRRGGDGNVYCTCPAWKFQKGVSPKERTCKHLKALAASMKKHG